MPFRKGLRTRIVFFLVGICIALLLDFAVIALLKNGSAADSPSQLEEHLRYFHVGQQQSGSLSSIQFIRPPSNVELSAVGSSTQDDKTNAKHIRADSTNKTMSGKNEDSLSGCMLIKDDNDILNEWLAYHYHTLNLRYLLVAVDPSSETSPTHIWDRWRRLTDMEITEWKDPDFLPSSFIEKGYYMSPEDISGDAKKSQWHEGHEDPEQVKADIMKITNHRFRQLTFYSSCLRHMRALNKTWVIHIDTDEYVVVNPLLRKNMNKHKGEKVGHRAVSRLQTPSLQSPSSIFNFFTKDVLTDRKLKIKTNYPCVSLPRLLFGSAENKSRAFKTAEIVQTNVFNTSNFETLNWKYHTHFNDIDRNAQPKVIVDVSTVNPNDEMFKAKAFSIHRPSKRLCRRLDQMNLTAFQRFPLSVNHYIGSWERYFARNDTRRSQRTYDFKAHVQNGIDDDWISEWLDGFVQQIGEETAKELLHDYSV
jgi:hypothetical protein